MNDNHKDKSKEELLIELQLLQKRINKLESVENGFEVGKDQGLNDPSLTDHSLTETYFDILEHDINNLNQAIIISNELMLMESDVSQDVSNHVRTSLAQAKAISALISDVRKLSAVDNSYMEITNMDFYDLFTKTVEKFKQENPLKKIKINHSIQPGQIFVKGNELLEDVIYKIIEHSVNSDKANKAVIDIFSSITNNDTAWEFEFKDHGPGIPDYMKEIVFSTNNVGKQNLSRNMLGFAIIKEIIVKCGGSICVEDRINGFRRKGSNFIILLPKGGS
jgi:light-regulated signal transduction histidine kinase (bacteriophytochrome)